MRGKNMTVDEMVVIHTAFKQQYPNIEDLNITQMKQVLDGVLVVKGKKVKRAGEKTTRKPRTPKAPKLKHNVAIFNREIGKAEAIIGDIMYEMFNGDMKAIELMSNEDLRTCRCEALCETLNTNVYDVEDFVNFWEKRGI
jgi:hypothetical protein